MNEIKAGKLLTLLTGFLGAFDNAIKKLADLGVEVKGQPEKQEDGSVIYTVWYNNESKEDQEYFLVKLVPTGDKATCKMEFKDPKSQKVTEVESVYRSKIDKEIEKYLKSHYGYDSFYREEGAETANSAEKFYATFQRITSADEDVVKLSAIECGMCTADMVLQNVNNILDDDDFVAGIEETPKSYEILDKGSELFLDEVPTTSVTGDDAYKKCLEAAYGLHNAICGILNARYSTSLDNMISDLCAYDRSICDQMVLLTELFLRSETNNMTGITPATMFQNIRNNYIIVDGFCENTAKAMLVIEITEYISCLELYIDQFPQDVQPTILTIIQTWQNVLDNKLNA